MNKAPKILKRASTRKECRATLSGLTIDVNGYMVPCPFLKLAGYYNKAKLPMFDKNFVQTWKNNYYFRKFRQGNLHECQARAFIFSKDIKGPDPYGIKAFKKYQEKKQKN